VTAREELESGDIDRFVAAFDEEAVWIGAVETEPAFRGRDAIERALREQLASGMEIDPEFVLDNGEAIVVDMHADPPPQRAPRLHHVFRIRDDRIVRIEDYPDRESALEAV
jgi:ketosteroid isomerase-like protein